MMVFVSTSNIREVIAVNRSLQTRKASTGHIICFQKVYRTISIVKNYEKQGRLSMYHCHVVICDNISCYPKL